MSLMFIIRHDDLYLYLICGEYIHTASLIRNIAALSGDIQATLTATTMPTLSVGNNIVFHYTDSGPIEKSEYSTLVLVHGLTFHTGM
jgi:hypothetical protein